MPKIITNMKIMTISLAVMVNCCSSTSLALHLWRLLGCLFITQHPPPKGKMCLIRLAMAAGIKVPWAEVNTYFILFLNPFAVMAFMDVIDLGPCIAYVFIHSRSPRGFAICHRCNWCSLLGTDLYRFLCVCRLPRLRASLRCRTVVCGCRI